VKIGKCYGPRILSVNLPCLQAESVVATYSISRRVQLCTAVHINWKLQNIANVLSYKRWHGISWLSARIVFERVRNLSSSPDAVTRSCIFGKDTYAIFLLGAKQSARWVPSLTKDMQTNIRRQTQSIQHLVQMKKTWLECFFINLVTAVESDYFILNIFALFLARPLTSRKLCRRAGIVQECTVIWELTGICLRRDLGAKSPQSPEN